MDQEWDVEGYVSGASQAAVVLAVSALNTALSIPNLDLTLYCDDGSVSATLLPNATSLSGVRITGLAYRNNQGAEYVLFRKFSFTATASYAVPGSQTLLLDFHETLTFTGGGPKFVVRNAINTTPQRQLVYPSTVSFCTQQGYAIGYRGYPQVPLPKFPQSFLDSPDIKKDSPKRERPGVGQSQGLYSGYRIEWTFRFGDGTPLFSNVNPTLWVW